MLRGNLKIIKLSGDYNARRQPLYEEMRAGTTAVSPQTAQTLLSRMDWVYDNVGWVTQEMRSSDMPGVPYAVTSTLSSPDRPRSVTDPRGNVLTHAYDGYGRLSVLSYPDGKAESYGGACPGLDPGTSTSPCRAPSRA